MIMVVVVVMMIMIMMIMMSVLWDSFHGHGFGAGLHSGGCRRYARERRRFSLTQKTEGGRQNTCQANLG